MHDWLINLARKLMLSIYFAWSPFFYLTEKVYFGVNTIHLLPVYCTPSTRIEQAMQVWKLITKWRTSCHCLWKNEFLKMFLLLSVSGSRSSVKDNNLEQTDHWFPGFMAGQGESASVRILHHIHDSLLHNGSEPLDQKFRLYGTLHSKSNG